MVMELIEESESYNQRALALYQVGLGNDHHRTVGILHKICLTLFASS